jgi:hypothetical protein
MRFFDMVSSGVMGYGCEPLPEEELQLDAPNLTHDSRMYMRSGRRVGRQPLIMPIEGSTELHINTSLFAQLMSVVRTRRVMVMMR